MSKIIPFAAAAAYLLACAPASSTTPPATLTSIKVCGKEFTMVYRESDASTGSVVAEYAQRGATPSTWTRLVTVYDLPPSETPSSYIGKIARRYETSHPGMKFSSGNSASTGEAWMDAVFVGSMHGSARFSGSVEWSFFRAMPRPSGTRVLQYSERRGYKDSPQEVYSGWDVSVLRKKLLPSLLSHQLP